MRESDADHGKLYARLHEAVAATPELTLENLIDLLKTAARDLESIVRQGLESPTQERHESFIAIKSLICLLIRATIQKLKSLTTPPSTDRYGENVIASLMESLSILDEATGHDFTTSLETTDPELIPTLLNVALSNLIQEIPQLHNHHLQTVPNCIMQLTPGRTPPSLNAQLATSFLEHWLDNIAIRLASSQLDISTILPAMGWAHRELWSNTKLMARLFRILSDFAHINLPSALEIFAHLLKTTITPAIKPFIAIQGTLQVDRHITLLNSKFYEVLQTGSEGLQGASEEGISTQTAARVFGVLSQFKEGLLDHKTPKTLVSKIMEHLMTPEFDTEDSLKMLSAVTALTQRAPVLCTLLANGIVKTLEQLMARPDELNPLQLYEIVFNLDLLNNTEIFAMMNPTLIINTVNALLFYMGKRNLYEIPPEHLLNTVVFFSNIIPESCEDHPINISYLRDFLESWINSITPLIERGDLNSGQFLTAMSNFDLLLGAHQGPKNSRIFDSVWSQAVINKMEEGAITSSELARLARILARLNHHEAILIGGGACEQKMSAGCEMFPELVRVLMLSAQERVREFSTTSMVSIFKSLATMHRYLPSEPTEMFVAATLPVLMHRADLFKPDNYNNILKSFNRLSEHISPEGRNKMFEFITNTWLPTITHYITSDTLDVSQLVIALTEVHKFYTVTMLESSMSQSLENFIMAWTSVFDRTVLSLEPNQLINILKALSAFSHYPQAHLEIPEGSPMETEGSETDAEVETYTSNQGKLKRVICAFIKNPWLSVAQNIDFSDTQKLTIAEMGDCFEISHPLFSRAVQTLPSTSDESKQEEQAQAAPESDGTGDCSPEDQKSTNADAPPPDDCARQQSNGGEQKTCRSLISQPYTQLRKQSEDVTPNDLFESKDTSPKITKSEDGREGQQALEERLEEIEGPFFDKEQTYLDLNLPDVPEEIIIPPAGMILF